MPTPPPDDAGPLPDAPDGAGVLPPTNGSTGSHRPSPSLTGSSLSDLLRANAGLPTRRATAAAEFAAHLLPPNAGSSKSPIPLPVDNTDDQPTIITANSSQPAPLPPPPYVVGDSPTLLGRTLGHYELIEAIGAGGMAAVLKARDTELGRIVALKILPPESAHDGENISRFKQEARAAAKLDHENVARVYYCGEDQGLHFIAFEFVEGPNLRNLIDRRGTLPAAECVGYMIQIAAGLAHAAERGVVHRDIKPSNIIITPHGRAKIVDMGLARLDTTPVNGAMTQSGVTLGTFDYISPEQALDPRRADVRSDLYSLGCTFYHALTGRPPVPEGTAAKKLHAHQQIPPLDPREINPSIPDALAIVLARMMMKDPARRYQTPAELIADLKRLIDPNLATTEFTLGDSVVRSITASESVLPPAPRLPVGLVLACVAAVIVVVALAMSSSDPGSATAPHWSDPSPQAKGGTKLKGTGAEPAPVTPKGRPATETVTPADAVALAEHTRSAAKTLHVRLAGPTYDLASNSAAFVGEPGQTLILEGIGDPAEVRVAALPLYSAADRTAGLSFTGYDAVRVKNVRFVVVQPEEAAVGDSVDAAGVSAVDVGSLTLTDCQFDARDENLAVSGAADVAVGRTSSRTATTVKAERCLFLPGAVGIRLCPRAELTIDDCGFAPQAIAAVQIPDQPEAEPSRVTLFRSSFMLDPRSAVIAVDGEANLRAVAGYCVFAPTTAAPAARSVVLRSGGESPQGLRFDGEDGQRNVYYHVDPLGLKSSDGPRTVSFEECRTNSWPIQDRGAVASKKLPWAAPELAGIWDQFAEWHRAFRLQPEAEIFTTSTVDGVKFVGARFAVTGRSEWGLTYETPLVRPVAASAVKEKVWWPSVAEEEVLPAGVYRDLAVLLLHVRSGDTVRIRHDGPLSVKPVTVTRNSSGEENAGEFTLTFKPYEDGNGRSRPVLTTGPTNRLDVAMFTLEDGDISFEDLQFRVNAGHQGALVWRQAVSMFGAKRCSFRSCVITLDEDGGKAAAVSIHDPEGRMMMPASATAAHVRFEESLVRGKGRWLWLPSSRAFEFDAANCVAAIEGPLLAIDPASRVAVDALSRVRFKRLTAILGGPVAELHAGKTTDGGTGLVRTEVEADECLFAAAPGTIRPIIEADGLDVEAFRDALTWSRPIASTRHNWYVNFDPSAPVAEFNLAAEGMPSKKWEWKDWLSFGDRPVGNPVGKATFAGSVRELNSITPADVKVATVEFPEMTGARPGDVGASTETLPKPE